MIQTKFRQNMITKDKVKVHGNMCDRGSQTDPVNPFQMAFSGNRDKMKKLLFGIIYTMMMMHSIVQD